MLMISRNFPLDLFLCLPLPAYLSVSIFLFLSRSLLYFFQDPTSMSNFRTDVLQIWHELPKDALQTLLFSATFPR